MVCRAGAGDDAVLPPDGSLVGEEGGSGGRGVVGVEVVGAVVIGGGG